MSNFLKSLFSKDSFSKEELVELSICPNCWGHQEYQDRYVEYVKDQTKSQINNDKTQQKAFVQRFVETHITGIRLVKDGDQLSCRSCKSGYKTISRQTN